MNRNIFFLILISLLSGNLFCQIENYQFKQALTGINDDWHKIQIPPSTFKNLKSNRADIRIFGIRDTDTIEAPYILQESIYEEETKQINFKIINQSNNSRGYFYTFVLEGATSINQILLNFNSRNFDFDVKLEGSNRQGDWYTIIDNYHLIAIQNRFVDFSFTKLNFSESLYKYYRLQLKTKTNPKLANASISLQASTEAKQIDFQVEKFIQTNNSDNKKTVLEFSVQDKLPVSEIQLDISNNKDFYRRYYLTYLSDSVKTEKGYIKNYKRLASGTLHSFEPSIIKFPTTIASHFKVEIENQDNMPLLINSAVVKGNRFYLTTRLDVPAQYFMAYGNDNAALPNYDITYFKEKIPENISYVQLGVVQKIQQKEKAKIEPLFANSVWMYIILVVIILLLAVFSFQMLKNTKLDR